MTPDTFPSPAHAAIGLASFRRPRTPLASPTICPANHELPLHDLQLIFPLLKTIFSHFEKYIVDFKGFFGIVGCKLDASWMQNQSALLIRAHLL